MADYYYKTLGEARQAIVSAFTAFGQLTYTSATLAIVWTPGATANGGHFDVSGDVLFGSQYANGSYWAAEGKTGAALAIGRVSREVGLGIEARVEQLATIGAATALQLMTALADALDDALADVCDGSADTPVAIPTTLSGAGNPVIRRRITPWASTNDEGLAVTTVVVTNELPATSALSEPIVQAYLPNTQPIVQNIIQQGPRYDIDQAINGGGSIWSISSRQLTSE